MVNKKHHNVLTGNRGKDKLYILVPLMAFIFLLFDHRLHIFLLPWPCLMHWRKQRRDFQTLRRMIVTHRWKEVHNFLSMSWEFKEFWRKTHIPRSDKRATLLAECRENKNKHKTNPLKVWNITLRGEKYIWTLELSIPI